MELFIFIIFPSVLYVDYFMSEHRLGIVVEGGGIRGIYAAGVLDVLLEQFTAAPLSPAKKEEVFVFISVFALMIGFSVLRHC